MSALLVFNRVQYIQTVSVSGGGGEVQLCWSGDNILQELSSLVSDQVQNLQNLGGEGSSDR
jgi:hypothetical protein